MNLEIAIEKNTKLINIHKPPTSMKFPRKQSKKKTCESGQIKGVSNIGKKSSIALTVKQKNPCNRNGFISIDLIEITSPFFSCL
jgi:hypothetical protein